MPGADDTADAGSNDSHTSNVINLTRHIGTEIVGLQLKDRTDKQEDELGLLIAERSVVFFRDQDISPQQQKELGEWIGEIEVHPQVAQVPGVPGVTVILPELQAAESDLILGYLCDVYKKNPDIQIHFKLNPRTSALWDNRKLTSSRITIHNTSWDYEGSQLRHGTRVTSLAGKPVFDSDAPTRRDNLFEFRRNRGAG
ncbi:Taurine catabolism dioxygenase TauD/TfdA [Penicillium argentinense]|uniref:Taurine catabolism dioxygenase TauD/TfdA n=1 Tax=Penicillium argentinense TaxID=1131581 RepID=A0A9W9FD61_9EURO|nr:Taurine catabolism dioxygenase TauD/TfdA [Penicillium argentinense]KAJ5097915.1 Taurine catabolism dioxygenase TauD/TfdA [Penicillium argentinense]